MAGPTIHRAGGSGGERNSAGLSGVVFPDSAAEGGGIMTRGRNVGRTRAARAFVFGAIAVAVLAASELESARDRQDRAALEKLAAKLETTANDAAGHYRAALA